MESARTAVSVMHPSPAPFALPALRLKVTPKHLVTAILVALVVFCATNVDNLLVMTIFLADSKMRPRSVILGQFLGNGALVLAGILAGLLALAIPSAWTALLGIAPVLLGIRGFIKLLQRRPTPDAAAVPEQERKAQAKTRSQTLAVALVTMAIGGDNLGIYIPLFAKTPAEIPVYVAVFALLIALSCLVSRTLVKNKLLSQNITRYGHVIIPFILLGVGIYILWGALPLFTH